MVTQAWPINSDMSVNDGCWREAAGRGYARSWGEGGQASLTAGRTS